MENLEQIVAQNLIELRKAKGWTQAELAEKINYSDKSVSKWERGETLPDTAILPDLAEVLETTVDNLLCASERMKTFKRRATVADAAEGIACFERIGQLLGRDSYFYLGAIEGCDRKMNIELEKYLSEPVTREAMIAEAVVQMLMNGVYVDISDIRRSFQFDHWVRQVTEMAEKYGVK